MITNQKTMKKILLAFVALAISINALCAPADYTFLRDISYRTGDEYTNSMCLLDVAYVPGTTDRPVIVWFHGGGLTGGHRDMPQAFLGRNYVVVDVEYRLAPKVTVPEILEDGAAAVAWVCKNIETYGGSREKIYLSGHSAGGYIVDMLCLNKKLMAPYGIDSDSFAAIVPYSGQTVTHYTYRASQGIDPLTPVIDELAPLFHVRPGVPPFLVMSADRELEMYGRYEEQAYFVRMLKLHGNTDVKLLEFDGYDHGGMPQPGHPVFMRYIAERERNAQDR